MLVSTQHCSNECSYRVDLVLCESYQLSSGSKQTETNETYRSSNGVRRQEGNNLGHLEASVGEPLNNGIDGVRGLGYGKVLRGLRRRGTTEEEVELRSTGAVGRTDSGSQMNEVTSRQVRGLEDGELHGRDVINSVTVCQYRCIQALGIILTQCWRL